MAKRTGDDFKRVYLNAVVLPTGDIFIEGGTSVDNGRNHCFANCCLNNNKVPVPVRAPIIYDPGADELDPGTVYPQDPPDAPAGYTEPTARLYHQVALLLPDGSVFVAGGKRPKDCNAMAPPGEPFPQYSGEVFRPPYLDLGTMNRGRPQLLEVPSEITFGETFSVGVSRNLSNVIDSIVLLRPGSVTHHWDNDQRYIELSFQVQSTLPDPEDNQAAVVLSVTAPDESLGPPGYYMLFAIEDDGIALEGHRIPSVAEFVDIQ